MKAAIPAALLVFAAASAHAQRIPEFVHGDECLFCHRNDIGPGWPKNAHGITVRQIEDAPELQQLRKQAPETEYFLGSRHRIRFLKKDGYGRFAILNTQAALAADHKLLKWVDAEKPSWDRQRFADRCAGCHATGVDPKTRTFAAFGIDCYACHGDVNLEHTNDTSLIWLSKKRRDDARAITSICAQCHLRGGKSKSTGLPYPAAFIAGNNLFGDYQMDFAKADDINLNAGDRHVVRNFRDVVVKGESGVTCLSCHRVHANSSSRHRLQPRTAICADCHNATGPMKVLKKYEVHSDLCEY
jgi:predicted CXXCH cytochrome family protein